MMKFLCYEKGPWADEEFQTALFVLLKLENLGTISMTEYKGHGARVQKWNLDFLNNMWSWVKLVVEENLDRIVQFIDWLGS